MEHFNFGSVISADYKKTIIRTAEGPIKVIPLDEVMSANTHVSIDKNNEAMGFVRFSFFGPKNDIFIHVSFGKLDDDTAAYPGLIKEGIQHVLDTIIGCYNVEKVTG